MGVITISREFGSGGETVASLVAEKSSFLLINKKYIIKGLSSFGVSEPELVASEKFDPDLIPDQHHAYINALHEFIYDMAIRNDLVILGRGGHVLFQDYPPALHVKIIASFDKRLERLMKQFKISAQAAHKLIKEQDRHKQNYYRQIFNVNWANLRRFDLVVNTSQVSLEDAAEIILSAYSIHGEPKHLSTVSTDTELEENGPVTESDPEKFMHPSEEKFAQMLDFYQIKWEYEPKNFLLEWDSEGNVLEAFSPDFYLPEQDLYVELTTQKSRQAWKKNKKIRRLKELYPEVNIRMINRKGFASLLNKQASD